MFNNNREIAAKSFIQFINKPNEDACLVIKENYRITDKDARIIIQNLCKVDHTIDLQKLDIATRNSYLKSIYKKHNLSIRQIERLTGINRGMIAKSPSPCHAQYVNNPVPLSGPCLVSYKDKCKQSGSLFKWQKPCKCRRFFCRLLIPDRGTGTLSGLFVFR